MEQAQLEQWVVRPGQAVEDRQATASAERIRFSKICQRTSFIVCTISDRLLFPPNKSYFSRQAARAERLASRRPTQPTAPEPAEMDVDDERPNQNQAPATTVQTQPAGLPQSDNARTQQERVGIINIICC